MLKDAGFDNVYQLEGGILAYLEKYLDGHWDGGMLCLRRTLHRHQRFETGQL